MRLCLSVVACGLVCCSSFSVFAGDDGLKPLSACVEKIRCTDPALRKTGIETLSERATGCFESLGDFDPAKLAALEQFRREAKPLIAELTKLLDHSQQECRCAAAISLALVGEEAKSSRPRLLQMLREKNVTNETLMASIAALLFVTPADQAVVPDLWEVVIAKSDASKPAVADKTRKTDKDEIAEARHVSTMAETLATSLAKMLADSGRTTIELPALINSIKATSPRVVRATAIAVLLRLDLDARKAVPELRKLLADDDRLIRHCAAQAVVTIEGEKTSVTQLVQAMHLEGREQSDFKKSVEEFLERRIGDIAELQKHRAEVVPEMLRILECGRPFYQRDAIRTLRDLDLDAAATTKVVPALLKALKSPDPETREVAREALQRIDPTSLGLSQVPRAKS